MPEPSVELRPWPYPYRALLAVCSDLDETPDRDVYWQIMRFLNTTGTTAMGPGVGLEIGNTIYFDMPPEQFSYWNTDDRGREMVRDLIHSGHIDCLHSFGDFADTREQAARALDELTSHDCALEVWVDHAVAPTNFGADIMLGHGDEVGHAAYHADLTVDFGVRYVWRGRVTSILGQDVAPRLGGLWTPSHPLASFKTLSRETVKRVAARCGSGKYGMHRHNRVLRRACLRDGSEVFEFMRCNPHWGGVSVGDTGRGIGDVLTAPFIERLVDRAGACILYTHLGKIHSPAEPFAPSGVAAFRRLAEARDAGRVAVLSTRRALRYLAAREAVAWSARREGQRLELDLRLGAPERLSAKASTLELAAGLTLFVPDNVQRYARLNGEAVSGLVHNPPDDSGRASVSIPLPALVFPGDDGCDARSGVPACAYGSEEDPT